MASIGGHRHHLGDHRVVLGRYAVSASNGGIHPDSRAGRHRPRPDATRCRRELARRILGSESNLDGVPGRRDGARRGVARAIGQWPPRGDPQLLRDQVEIGDELRDTVLDLQPRVDLEEPELSIPVEEELGRRRIRQAGGPRGADGHRVQLATLVGRQPGGRRFLDELLMATLDRAISLPQRDDLARGVAQQLHFDMPSRSDLALEIDGAIAERRARLARCGDQGRRKVRNARDPAHAPTPASRRSLDEEREADGFRGRHDPVEGVGTVDGRGIERPRDDRHRGRNRSASCRQLVAECLDRVGGRSDEHESRLDHGASERRALRQESVSRMDRFGAGRERRLDDQVGAEVTLPRRRRAQTHRLVGGYDVRGVDVGVGVHGDRLDAKIAAGADDAQGDLTAVGDEDARERYATVFAHRHGGCRDAARHRGMLPCFFGGLVSRLSASISSAAIRRGRVSDGRITSST